MVVKAKEKYDVKKDAEGLGKIIRTLGEAMGEVFEDPELRQKAKEFSQSVIDAAARVAESKMRTEAAKRKFSDAGRAAQSLGKTLVERFGTSEK